MSVRRAASPSMFDNARTVGCLPVVPMLRAAAFDWPATRCPTPYFSFKIASRRPGEVQQALLGSDDAFLRINWVRSCAEALARLDG